jgi:drug/metabolite transporter (DMT)-like permease
MSVMLIFLMYAIWSSCFALGKLALHYSPPVFLTGFRMLLAAVFLLLFLLIKKRAAFKLSLKQYLSLLLLGFFSVYLTNVCEFWGLQYLSAAKTCFIYSLSPFFAMLFSYIHFKEKLNLKKCLGLAVGFLGFIPVLHMQSGSEDLFSLWSSFSLPDLAVMGAALFSVYGWVLLRLFVKQEISPLMANGTSMLFGGLLALIHSLCIDTWSPWPIHEGTVTPFLGVVLVMTCVSNILCYNLYGYMLKKFTATFLSFAGLLSPIFASLNGWIILGEKPSPIIFLSTCIVSIGLWIVYQAELKQGYIKTSSSAKSTH